MMKDEIKVNKKRFLVYQILKTFALIFGFLTFIQWVMADPVYLLDNLLLALLITGGIIIPIFLAFKIVMPVFFNDTARERRKYFRENYIAAKLIVAMGVCTGLFFIGLRMLMPVFGLSFWQAAGISLGIGLLIASLCTIVIWFIIGLKKPPFQS